MSARRTRIVIATVVCLVGFACASRRITQVDGVPFGAPCTEQQVCDFPNVCGESGTCESSHAVAEGGACYISDDCAQDLYCQRGTCAPAGDGDVGEACDSTGDCLAGLRCNAGGLLGECGPGGERYKGGACTSGSECMAGLVCSPATHTCETTLGVEPGLGPDGVPLEPWDGATCPEALTFDGAFRVRFAVGQPNDDFFRQPYPDDSRLKNGRVTLAGFPRPPVASAPADIASKVIAASEAELTGFGPNETVFLRFSGPPRFCSDCAADQACLESCLGKAVDPNVADPGVYVADLTRTDDDFATHPFDPISYNWFASTNRRPYVCAPYLTLSPAAESPWRPGHTYLVFVHGRVRGTNGAAIVQDSDFAAMLSGTAPVDARLTDAYAAYEPLRAWLASSPTYASGDPRSGEIVTAADIAGGALFTVRDPTLPMTAIKSAVSAISAPAASDVAVCDVSEDTACQDAIAQGFLEVRGTMALPSFQDGDVPFERAGGSIIYEPGESAVVQDTVSVRVSVSLPSDTTPVSGWPVVLYAHGTGGDYRSPINEGLAALLTADGFAVVGFDQLAHGTRKGTSTAATELLVFNLLNPPAARGNVLQGAADILALKKGLVSLSTALESLPVVPSKLNLTKVTLLGHSQGATSGALAAALENDLTVVTLSGGGAVLIDTLAGKTAPLDLTQILPFALADAQLSDGATPPRLVTRRHPVLSILQGYMEEADPTNYALLLRTKNVLHFVGKGDSYTPNNTAMTLARRIDAQFVDDDDSNLLGAGDTKLTPPVRANRTSLTRVASLHVPSGDDDGHFVMFDDAVANGRLLEWLSTWLSDGSGVPTVVP